MIWSLNKAVVCPLWSLGHMSERTFIFCDAPVRHVSWLSAALARAGAAPPWLLGTCQTCPASPVLPLRVSHTAVSGIGLVLWLDHRPLLKSCFLYTQILSAMEVDRSFIAEPVWDFDIKEKTLMGNRRWPFTGKHWVFTWAEQCHSHFLFWLSSVFSCSVGWCLPHPWPMAKLQGSPGKAVYQACWRNSRGIQQGLLFSSAKISFFLSLFLFLISLSNCWPNHQTNIRAPAGFQSVLLLALVRNPWASTSALPVSVWSLLESSPCCVLSY